MDEDFLLETLHLAKKGEGWVNPNPMVGAILVKHGKVIGRGYHKQAGFPHAEIEAIRSCKVSPKGATLYVNLEPCSHFGKTPPCVDEIIKLGIKRVVCCTQDPNPNVNGAGRAKLKNANVDFKVGLLKDQARVLNETFFTFQEMRRPFVALKFASSLDGKMATRLGDSKWITNEKARQFARKLRGQYQAVLVGINTVLQDDPHLGVRVKGKKDPIRIILDPKLQIPKNSQVLRDENVIIVTTKKAEAAKRIIPESRGFKVIAFDGEINLNKLLTTLYEMQIISLLVEGGGRTLGNFIDAKIVDKVFAFFAPILIGGEKSISIGGDGFRFIKDAIKFSKVSYKKFDDNLLIIGYV